MPRVVRGVPLLVVLVGVLTGCRPASSGPPTISLSSGAVEITGLSTETLDRVRALSESDWPKVFRVAVSADAAPMLGTHQVDGNTVRFTPAFPLDAGRQYDVRFDATSLAGVTDPALAARVGTPARALEPSTEVTRIYPTADTVPENVLRMYVEFSAPMGRKSGVEYLRLLDHDGREIPGAVLPLDYEFWSPDHRRFTVFFDPGRVKDGILPNREMGRAFKPGTTVTLVVSKDWRDENGLPLKGEYRRTFTVTPADTRPLDPRDWRITAPRASTLEPLVVSFGKTLDRSLLLRTLGVRRSGNAVDGDVEIGAGETSWRFTPRQAWRTGSYDFLALEALEDVAGNQVGRAFEVDNFESVDKDPDPKQVLLPFQVR